MKLEDQTGEDLEFFDVKVIVKADQQVDDAPKVKNQDVVPEESVDRRVKRKSHYHSGEGEFDIKLTHTNQM